MPVIYTNRFIPKRFQAATYGPLILIRPQHKGDKGLLEHEKTHVKQWRRRKLTHAALYRMSRSYRLDCEVEAYKRQLQFQPGSCLFCATALSQKYDLRITVTEAVRLIC